MEKTIMDNNIIINANDVKKTYDTGKVKVEALKGIDIQVARGEMVAIMGPSGSGKTTVLNTLSGLDTIDSGIIEIEGRDLAGMSDRQRTSYRAQNMGFVFQFYNLLPVLTAVENVEMPLLLDTNQKISAGEARKQALAALEDVGLSEQADQYPAELSGGQRQRVTIARALVNKPAIVWADEPTGDLDSQTSQDIMDLMRKLNQENGQTFIIVTHSLNIGEQTDRIIWMRDGRIEMQPEFPSLSHSRANGHQSSRNYIPAVKAPELQIAVEPIYSS